MSARNNIRKLTKSESGRIGGLARQRKYGDVGTSEGRSKGGRHSLATHKRLNTGFKLLRAVRFPRQSVRLAEFLGIIMGDGHVGKYQVTFCTNSITDSQHAKYVFELAQTLFSAPIGMRKNTDSNAVTIFISSKEVCRFMKANGIPEGNKISKGIVIPNWVVRDVRYSRRLCRGLFDTDGCVFLDTHRIRGKTYRNGGIAFSNREKNLLAFFYTTLRHMGLAPTQTSPFGVFLRRKRDIEHYFAVVGTSNEKHISRFQRFAKNGGVA